MIYLSLSTLEPIYIRSAILFFIQILTYTTVSCINPLIHIQIHTLTLNDTMEQHAKWALGHTRY